MFSLENQQIYPHKNRCSSRFQRYCEFSLFFQEKHSEFRKKTPQNRETARESAFLWCGLLERLLIHYENPPSSDPNQLCAQMILFLDAALLHTIRSFLPVVESPRLQVFLAVLPLQSVLLGLVCSQLKFCAHPWGRDYNSN